MKLLAKKPAASKTGTKGFRWTVGRKIAALGLAGLFAAVAVMFVQRQAIGQLADATQRTALTAWALRDGMQAAATGQALRADVYLALRATDPKDADAARATVRAGRTIVAREPLDGEDQVRRRPRGRRAAGPGGAGRAGGRRPGHRARGGDRRGPGREAHGLRPLVRSPDGLAGEPERHPGGGGLERRGRRGGRRRTGEVRADLADAERVRGVPVGGAAGHRAASRARWPTA